MANFGIGIGAFADGLLKGINTGRAINQDKANAEDAADRKKLRDLQFKQLEQDVGDKQAFRDTASQAAEGAKTARATDIQNAMTPTGNGTWKVGDKEYSSEAEATKAADGQVGSFMDYYMKTSVPKMQEHWAATGQIDKAQALGKWMEDENVKKGTKAWAGAVRAFQTGDREGFKKNLMSAYNQQGYFDDGMEATSIEDMKNDKGELTGYSIKFKGADGKETTKDFNGSDVANLALNALSPAQVLSHGLDQIKAAQSARVEIAKEDRGFKRDVAKIEMQQQGAIDGQVNASQLRMAEKADERRTGGDSAKVRDAKAIAGALRSIGKDEKYINSVYPQLLGIERGSKSETDRLDGYIATMGKNDLDFAGLPASQQVERAREMMKAVDGVTSEASGATGQPTGAPGGVAPVQSGKGIPLWDSKTNTLIYR